MSPPDSLNKTDPGDAQDPNGQRSSSFGRVWIVGLLSVGAAAALGSAAMWGGVSSPEASVQRATYAVKRGNLIVSVTEEGTLESSKNTEVKCQIRGGYGGRGGQSTVTWVIPSGSIVKSGDELVKLDTKIIEETISLGKTDTNIAKAELARAQADLANAKIAIDAYLSGRYRTQMKQLEKQRKIAKWNLQTAKSLLEDSKKLFEQGYITELELEGNGYSVRQAELELEVTDTQIDVLERLTRAMELETLNGQLTATQARVAGRQAGLDLEQGRLDLAQEEFKNCVIRAKQDGLVIYPSTAKWKDTPDVTEGASVHNNQVLLLMPDLTQMQLRVGIHESIIDRVNSGQEARVALPNRTLDAEVTSVAAVARPAGWWSGNEVKYDAIIRLPSEPGLNPGMSAKVEVIVASYEDVLSVPVAAVVATDEGRFCWVESGDRVERRSLQLGDSNDEFIIVESGLSSGDQVVLNPLATVEEARQFVAPPLYIVGRGQLRVTLTEQGTLESSNNTNIKCRVRGASTVNWVIESGTEVEAGDELVRLENKQIEDHLHERRKFAHLSRDSAVGFRADATRAGLAISEYLEGRFRTQLMSLEKDLAIAEESLRTAENMQAHAQMMYKRGYVSEIEVEEKEFAVRQANLSTEIVRTDIKVLKDFTKEEELETLKGNWEAAKAAANGHEEVLKMDEARIALAEKEMERCIIKSPKSGLVIYPKGEQWKDEPDIAEGATVHHDQVLLLMPDLTQMQVKVGIHESMVESVQVGMKAIVTVPGQTIEGKVATVASAAQPAGWWTGNVVKYDTIIQLPSVEGLKPGMTAEVEIMLGQHDNVMLIPVSAVVETAGRALLLGRVDHPCAETTSSTGREQRNACSREGGIERRRPNCPDSDGLYRRGPSA